MTDYLKQIAKAAADKFCGWKLPQDFYPDCHISFDREKASTPPHSWPIGTNLLTHAQAQAMFEHCLTDALAQQREPIGKLVIDAHGDSGIGIEFIIDRPEEKLCIGQLVYAAAPAAQPDNEADELLRNLGLDPEQYRTDGGYINHLKVKAAIRHPENYKQKCAHEWVTAPASLGGRICKHCGRPEPVGAAPAAQPDARNVIEQMVKALEMARSFEEGGKGLARAAIQAGQQWLEVNNGGAG